MNHRRYRIGDDVEIFSLKIAFLFFAEKDFAPQHTFVDDQKIDTVHRRADDPARIIALFPDIYQFLIIGDDRTDPVFRDRGRRRSEVGTGNGRIRRRSCV